MNLNINKNSYGFTLVEVIVTSVLTIILGTLVFFTFQMPQRQMTESTMFSSAQRQFDNVLAQMTATIRLASLALPGNELPAFPINPLRVQIQNSQNVILFDRQGNTIGGYQIVNNILQEFVNNQWIDFQAGGGVVQLTAGQNGFDLPPLRNSVTIRLSIQTNAPIGQFQLPTMGCAVACRN